MSDSSSKPGLQLLTLKQVGLVLAISILVAFFGYTFSKGEPAQYSATYLVEFPYVNKINLVDAPEIKTVLESKFRGRNTFTKTAHLQFVDAAKPTPKLFSYTVVGSSQDELTTEADKIFDFIKEYAQPKVSNFLNIKKAEVLYEYERILFYKKLLDTIHDKKAQVDDPNLLVTSYFNYLERSIDKEKGDLRVLFLQDSSKTYKHDSIEELTNNSLQFRVIDKRADGQIAPTPSKTATSLFVASLVLLFATVTLWQTVKCRLQK